jgi:murein DD-endopeptidase MepM/ murein hydrolase activator NlpD
MRKHPILNTVRRHAGTDYAASAGTPVRALGDGVVIFAGWRGGYGRTLEIRHRNGFVTRYAHLKGFAAGIKRGTSVSISRTVGYVGATGLATAPHLHFEVLVGGVHRDPRVALRNVTGEPLATRDREAFSALRSALFTRLEAAIAANATFASHTAGE